MRVELHFLFEGDKISYGDFLKMLRGEFTRLDFFNRQAKTKDKVLIWQKICYESTKKEYVLIQQL